MVHSLRVQSLMVEKVSAGASRAGTHTQEAKESEAGMFLAFFLSFSLGPLSHRLGISTFGGASFFPPGKFWKPVFPEMCLLGGSECGQVNKTDHHRSPSSSSCAQAEVWPYLPHNTVGCAFRVNHM